MSTRHDRDHDRQHAAHSHGPTMASAGERHRTPLVISFVLITGFLVVEAVAGLLTGSLALLSDAGHMLTDAIGLGMALAAIQVASRYRRRSSTGPQPDPGGTHTYGVYRLEILAAFVNALLLFAVAIWVMIEAVRRLFDEPHVLGVPMLVVAALGLVVNLVAFFILREGARESMNVEGAYLEVLADTVGSVGVIVAAVLIETLGWMWIDPVIAILIGLWILPRTWRLGRSAVRVLLQAAPEHVDLVELERDLLGIDGVTDVHDLHVWTLTSAMEAATAHLVISTGTDSHGVLDQARAVLSSTYLIEHGTFQLEPESHQGCSDLSW